MLPLLLLTDAARADRGHLTGEDAKLAAAFQKYLDEEFHRHPAFATSQGNHELRRSARRPVPEAHGLRTPTGRRSCSPTWHRKIDAKKLTRDRRRSTSKSGRTRCSPRSGRPRHDSTGSRTTRGCSASSSRTACTRCSRNPRCRRSGTPTNAAKRVTYIPKVIADAKASLTEPAAHPHGNRHQAEPGGDRLLREGHLTASPARRRAPAN